MMVPTVTRYRNRQIVCILVLYGRKSTERHLLPKISKNFQQAKDYYGTGTELGKWFSSHQILDAIIYQFHKELDGTVHKLMFSFGLTLLVDNAHICIILLVFMIMLAKDQH